MSEYKIGHGWDLHRLEPLPPHGEGKRLLLGGIHVETEKYGPVGHSDADALIHAIIDALCGAMGGLDIGDRFPPEDPMWMDANSLDLLKKIKKELDFKKLIILNLDSTIILEKPKLNKYKHLIKTNISRQLSLPINSIGIKAKTRENMENENCKAIEAHCVVLLKEKE